VYRYLQELRNVRTSLKYAAAKGGKTGRIRFFLPKVQWDLEVTRDGNNLEEYVDKFGSNSQSVNMRGNILVGCRLDRPQALHLSTAPMRCLYQSNSF
jgi:hypothetical protein